MSWNSSINKVTCYGLGDQSPICGRGRHFSLQNCVWIPPSLLPNGYHKLFSLGLSGWNMKLMTVNACSLPLFLLNAFMKCLSTGKTSNAEGRKTYLVYWWGYLLEDQEEDNRILFFGYICSKADLSLFLRWNIS